MSCSIKHGMTTPELLRTRRKSKRHGWLLRQLKGESRTAAEVVMGGHARPRQSVEDRKGPLRDTEGRQNGDDLHVPCATEEA